MLSITKWTLPLVAAALLMVGFATGTLRAEPAATGGKGTITGTVTKDNAPVANVEVRLMVPRGTAKAAATQPSGSAATGAKAGKGAGKNEAIMTATTDDKGMFTMNDVPEGSYNLVTGKRADGMGRAKVEVKAGETQDVAITVNAMGKK